MKGPFERLKYDLRRVWECPLCKNHERTDGGVTYFVCRCREKDKPGALTVMKLVSDGPRRVDGIVANTHREPSVETAEN